MHWGWPQWVMAGLYAMALVVNVSQHGESRGEYNGPAAFLTGALGVWILYMGGFWS